jgi:2-polyprenyl-6-methoxyphenol hydroxylase-like FAD-dependent oxidoreductase
VPTRCRFVAFMPQWHFLDFLAGEGGRHPNFDLRMQAEATALIADGGRVVGVRATTPAGALEIRADLVIAADGRTSRLRSLAGLPVQDLGAPMDVLWFRLSHRPGDPGETMGRIVAGHALVLIDRGDYWQCGDIIPKGEFDTIRARGLDTFRAELVEIAPFLGDRVGELASWDDVKLLTVQVDRALRWYRPGLLCIGDAAHAMSPIGGVGINLAIQDAVAAANRLTAPLRAGRLTDSDLAAVQRRREFPTRVTQRIQLLAQERIIRPLLARIAPVQPPAALRLLARFPVLQQIPARLIGVGVRPEHVRPGAP